MSRPGDPDDREEGAGLVELLVAGVLGLLGLAVVAAVARGPVAAATAAARPQDRVEGTSLLHDEVAARVRRARGPAGGPAVLAAAADHLVLASGPRTGPGWWRLSIADEAVRVDVGEGAVPSGPARDARALLRITDGVLVVRDALGAALVGDGDGLLPPGDPRLVDVALVELHLEVDGRPRRLDVALRAPS